MHLIATDELPTLEELKILKYTDEGKKHKVRIISEASHKWMDIADLICGDANAMTTLEQKRRGDPKECLRQTFIDYFINKKPQGYTQDWNGLIELLDDIELETLAENVKHALLYAR
jgi:predicted HAD superfamily hydrolase